MANEKFLPPSPSETQQATSTVNYLIKSTTQTIVFLLKRVAHENYESKIKHQANQWVSLLGTPILHVENIAGTFSIVRF